MEFGRFLLRPRQNDKIEIIKGVKCRHLQRYLLTKFLTYPSSYLPPHFALRADQNPKKSSTMADNNSPTPWQQ